MANLTTEAQIGLNIWLEPMNIGSERQPQSDNPRHRPRIGEASVSAFIRSELATSLSEPMAIGLGEASARLSASATTPKSANLLLCHQGRDFKSEAGS